MSDLNTQLWASADQLRGTLRERTRNTPAMRSNLRCC